MFKFKFTVILSFFCWYNMFCMQPTDQSQVSAQLVFEVIKLMEAAKEPAAGVTDAAQIYARIQEQMRQQQTVPATAVQPSASATANTAPLPALQPAAIAPMPNLQTINAHLEQLKLLTNQLQRQEVTDHGAHAAEIATTVAGLEEGIVQIATRNPQGIATLGNAVTRINNPVIKVVVGFVFLGVMLFGNQWLSNYFAK